MAGRKLLRDFLLSKRALHPHLCAYPQVSISTTRLRLLSPNSYKGIRQLSFFKDVSKKVQEEAKRDPEFEQSVKELKKKAEELKVVKEDLKVRTKQTTEQLYKHVDGVWTEAEATAKKVSSNLKEKVSAATEEVKETLGIGKQDSSGTSAKFDSGESDGSKSASGEDKQHQSGSSDATETLFSKVKSSLSKISPTISSAFQRVKDTKPVDFAKKGYGIVKDELSGTPTNKKRLEYAEPSTNSSANVEGSTISDLVVVPSKQSRWSKTWEAFKEKLQGHPVYKRVGGISKPVVVKSQELVEDVREMWEVSDNPVVHKIQDLNETVFGETAAGISMKEIRRRDPSFSLPEFLEEIHEVIRPILTAYDKGDTKFLEKYCCSEIIERCKAEHRAYESQNIVIHNKILHISDVEVRETKMMGDTPIIIVVFRTQQVYCIKDKLGSVTEGSKDTILTVYYGWAMQRVDEEELEEGAPFPIWKLREMQKSGVQALI